MKHRSRNPPAPIVPRDSLGGGRSIRTVLCSLQLGEGMFAWDRHIGTTSSKCPAAAPWSQLGQQGPNFTALGSNFSPTWPQGGAQLGPMWEQLGPKLKSAWLQDGDTAGPIRILKRPVFTLGPTSCEAVAKGSQVASGSLRA